MASLRVALTLRARWPAFTRSILCRCQSVSSAPFWTARVDRSCYLTHRQSCFARNHRHFCSSAPSSPPPPPAASSGSSSSSSSNGDSSGESSESSAPADGEEGETIVDGPSHDPHTHSITKFTIPDVFPNVPLIAIPRAPLFPRFLRVVELKDKVLMELLTRKISLSQPYVGLFLRRDDENDSSVVTSLDQVHSVGTFAVVLEVHNTPRDSVTLFLSAQRRVRITGIYDESAAAANSEGAQSTGVTETEEASPVAEEEVKKEDVVEAEAEEKKLTEDGLQKPDDGTQKPDDGQVTVIAQPFGFLTRLRPSLGPVDLKPADAASAEAGEDQSSAKTEPEKEASSSSGPTQITMVTVENLRHEPYKVDVKVRALTAEVIKTIRELIALNPYHRDVFAQAIDEGRRVIDRPPHLADFSAAMATSEPEDLQRVLDELNIPKRLEISLELIKKQYEVAKFQQRISKEVDEKMTKYQRKTLLMEQLKIIKRELGMEKGDKETLIEKFRERIKGLSVPEAARKVIDEEIDKLSFLEENSSEFSTTRTYLDWLTIIPWGTHTKDNFDIKKARQILDEDHFGMKDIKERILEFIAVSRLKGSVHGKILCFVGPPGVGKTSVAKSIARALDRKYFRFSVGGMSDVAEIKGHRRTYVGALPGKFIQCLKKSECMNPVVLIDEVDKMVLRSIHGDPASALLEALDPEQNSGFLDHYLDVPVDLSKILFICTANEIPQSFPVALTDRMEVIDVSGYISEEKIEIAKRFLIPTTRTATGISNEQVAIEDGTLASLITSYCRESGVRNLKMHIEKIFRKAALKIVQDDVEELKVNKENLTDFVGQPVHRSDRLYAQTPPGVVMGMAWTAHGGSTFFVETGFRQEISDGGGKEGGDLRLTGNLGKTMIESCEIALVFARTFARQHQLDKTVLKGGKLHLHIPEGAVQKDGPSAGVAIVTAFISLATGRPARQNITMTGEISLTGKVLAVGGIKEKIMAARRSGVTTIILPEENRHDFNELDEFIRKEVDIHFVEHYSDAFPILFDQKDIASISDSATSASS